MAKENCAEHSGLSNLENSENLMLQSFPFLPTKPNNLIPVNAKKSAFICTKTYINVQINT